MKRLTYSIDLYSPFDSSVDAASAASLLHPLHLSPLVIFHISFVSKMVVSMKKFTLKITPDHITRILFAALFFT